MKVRGNVNVAELRPRPVAMLNEYLWRWQPLIFSGSTPYLFCNGSGEPVDPRLFASRLSRLVGRRLDVEFNLHVLRSLLTSLYADANPDDQKTAQLKLHHLSADTTARFYILPQQRKAIRRFDDAIDEIVRQGERYARAATAPGGFHDVL